MTAKEVWTIVGCLFLGSLIVANWWFAMFSDNGYGDICRGIGEAFGGRNSMALSFPMIGMCLLLGSGMLWFVDTGREESPVAVFFGFGFIFSAVVALVGMIPFRLPDPMYPEWRLEKRRRRAEEAAPPSDHADTAGARSGDYLPPRVRTSRHSVSPDQETRPTRNEDTDG